MIVYFGITLAYIVATGTGASVGYGVGHISTDPDGPLSFALWGGIVGIGVVSIALYWIREYILYVVKAGHIAVMSAYLARLASGKTYLGLRDFGKKLTSYLGKRADSAITRAVEHGRALRRGIAGLGQRQARHQERQVGGDDEHHQGSIEGCA